MSVRFAPSPTGAFHIGNFRTAWISHQWAQKLSCPWILRFDDIDKPRNVVGAQERQIQEMSELGLKADGIIIQSQRSDRHWSAWRHFLDSGFIYPCYCSRKEVSEALKNLASAPHEKVPLYNGHCRRSCEQRLNSESFKNSHSPQIGWRLKMPEESGTQDFIIARTSSQLDSQGLPDAKTFVPSYHWATAIDDYDGNYNLLVRAWDLQDATEPQREIQRLLGLIEGKEFTYPAVYHTALITDNQSHRLEKRTQGVTLPELKAVGCDAPALIRLFEKSFAFNEDWQIGKVFGEKNRILTLKDLGGL